MNDGFVYLVVCTHLSAPSGTHVHIPGRDFGDDERQSTKVEAVVGREELDRLCGRTNLAFAQEGFSLRERRTQAQPLAVDTESKNHGRARATRKSRGARAGSDHGRKRADERV